MNAMQSYIKTQIYIDHFYDILTIKKIKRNDGIIVMRAFRTVKMRNYGNQ